MQIKKEIRAGKFYEQACYSAGILKKQPPAQRSKRKQMQTEAKRLINFIERKYYLMQLFGVNFKPNRDLFIELSFAKEPTEKEEKRALERFHRRMNTFFKKKGKQYRYILVRETHNRDGQPVRQHYHIVCTGTGQLMQEKIIEFWGMGGVNVQSLRELSDNFEDTCQYLLKEKSQKMNALTGVVETSSDQKNLLEEKYQRTNVVSYLMALNWLIVIWAITDLADMKSL